jgi:COP9 signalosome complex subunit 6
MDIDGAEQAKSIKFKELVYSIETGEAEMISVDFVARGGGNATAVGGSADLTSAKTESPKVDESTGKKNTRGKQKEKEKEEKDVPIDGSVILTADDDEGTSISAQYVWVPTR